MPNRTWLSVALAVVFAFALSAAAFAEDAHEAGPEDGVLCCNAFTSFQFSDDQVLVATGRAGIFRSDHHGDNWQRSMDGLVAPNGVSPLVVAVCQSASKPRVVYALVGLDEDVSPFNGLYSSDDFGKTWTQRGRVNTGFGDNLCTVDAADPRTVYVTGFDDSSFTSMTWRSTDGGRTLLDISSILPPCAVGGFVYPARGAVYVNGVVCVVVSTDGGATFHVLSTPPGAFFGLSPSPDGRAIFLATYDDSDNFIRAFRSTDGGVSYVPVSGLASLQLAFDPTNRSVIYASDGALKISRDGGLSFTALPGDPRYLPVPIVGLIGVDPQGSVFVNNLAGPFRSDDRGKTYRLLLNEFRASSVQDLAFDANGNLLVGVLHTRVVYRQTHDDNFSPLGTPLLDPSNNPNNFEIDAAAVGGSPANPNVVLVAIPDFGIFRTADGGQSWTSAGVSNNAVDFSSSRMRFATASRVYVVAPNQASGLYRSDDAGKNFALLSNQRLGAIAVHPTNPDTIYVGTFGDNTGLFKSTDGGQTLKSLGHAGDFSALVVDRQNPQVIYAGERLGQLIRSRDGGQTFAAASRGLVGAGVHGLAQDSNGTLYVWMRGGGLFSSKDGASTWKKVNSDEAQRRSGVEAGRGTLVVDPRRPGRVYLGNAGVLQLDN
jgi:photosystem II stability/assembly factor-like uncharacterized protein